MDNSFLKTKLLQAVEILIFFLSFKNAFYMDTLLYTVHSYIHTQTFMSREIYLDGVRGLIFNLIRVYTSIHHSNVLEHANNTSLRYTGCGDGIT